MTNFPLDKETFCDQVIRNQEAMFRTAKSILRQDEDAEDAVQEAICAAYASRGSLRDPARFRPWILKILVNKCYEFCRRMYHATGAFVTPGACFEEEHCVRIGYAYGRQALRDGLAAFSAFLDQLAAEG